MGSGAPLKEALVIETKDITQRPHQRVEKKSTVDVKDPQRDVADVIIGLKVRQGQAIETFMLDNTHDLMPFADAQVSTMFKTALAGSTTTGEEWKGFRVPASALPRQGGTHSTKLRTKFDTALTLSNATLTEPNFQIVPILVAFDQGELQQGHYWIGFSFIRAA